MIPYANYLLRGLFLGELMMMDYNKITFFDVGKYNKTTPGESPGIHLFINILIPKKLPRSLVWFQRHLSFPKDLFSV